MLTIKFQGQEWLFPHHSLEKGGPICTPKQYAEGIVSYAHLFKDGIVRRFNEPIGTIKDIEVLGPAEDPCTDPARAIFNLFTHPSWDEPPETSAGDVHPTG